MPAIVINENTNLLRNEQHKTNDYRNHQQESQEQQQQGQDAHCIDVLDKPAYNGYDTILGGSFCSASLTLEELLPFIDDPWWQKLRRTLFCTFILVFWLVLLTACGLAYLHQDRQCEALLTNKPISTTTAAIIMLQKSY